MNTDNNPMALYAVEPGLNRLCRLLTDLSREALRLYWELFVSIPVRVISFSLASICLVVGIVEVMKSPANWVSDAPLIVAASVYLLFSRVRAFCWASLACSIFWMPLAVTVLVSILGANYKAGSVAANIAVCLFYFVPPLVGAIFIERARHSGKRG